MGLRDHWPLGLVIGLLLPVASIFASVYLGRWLDRAADVTNTVPILWLVCGLIGAALVLRPIWLAAAVAVACIPVLGFCLAWLHLGVSCALVGSCI